MQNSFDDMILDVESGTIRSELLRPLSVLVKPLSTPKLNRSHSDGNNTPTYIDLFPQPHPSIEDEASSSDLQAEPVSKIRNEIKEGKLKGLKIKRKAADEKIVRKENEPSATEKSSRS